MSATWPPADPAPMRAWNLHAREVLLAALALATLLAPLTGLPAFLQSLAIEVFIFAIVAMSLDLLLGYAGLVSFGHAAFFGAGAYATGIIYTSWTTEIWVVIPASMIAGVLLALPVGWLSVRLSGFYFLMITFAFAQMAYTTAYHWKWLSGGSDGLLLPSPTLFGQPTLQSNNSLYYLTFFAFLVSGVLLWRIARSPFGSALVGIRECPRRMRAIGYNVRLVKLKAFLIAAAFASLGGSLSATFNHIVAPDVIHWSQSAQILIMVLIGGAGTLVGPILGAAIVLLVQHWLSSFTQYWSLFLGLLFIALISAAPSGVIGLLRNAWPGSGPREP